MSDTLTVFCDGGARGNPGPAAAAFVIKDHQGKVLAQAGQFLGKATNNVAEYQGVIRALSWLKDNLKIFNFRAAGKAFGDARQFSIFNFYLDSKLIVCQLNGLYKIKSANLRLLAIAAKKLEAEVGGKVAYHLIPREKNYLADLLVNQTLDKETL